MLRIKKTMRALTETAVECYQSGCIISVSKIYYECTCCGLSSLPTAKNILQLVPSGKERWGEEGGGGEGRKGLILRRILYVTNTNEGEAPRNIRRVKKSL